MNEEINCKGCGSTNVLMTDYSPLALEENLIPIGQFDNELYAEFKCFDCEKSFQQVLKISIR
jgi:DNA-directed RNA polymerase subunit RPC12/RpoP